MAQVADPVIEPAQSSNNQKLIRRYSKVAMNWLNGLPTSSKEMEFEPEQIPQPNGVRRNLGNSGERSNLNRENWIRKSIARWKKKRRISIIQAKNTNMPEK